MHSVRTRQVALVQEMQVHGEMQLQDEEPQQEEEQLQKVQLQE